MFTSKRYYVFCNDSALQITSICQSLSHYSNLRLTLRQENEKAPPPHSKIAAVPQRIALAPDRFYIWLLIDFERWAVPLQLSELEARLLLPLVDGERDRAVILKIVESAIAVGCAS